jgi:hypothetical protein
MRKSSIAIAIGLSLAMQTTQADDSVTLEALNEKLNQLLTENQQLKQRLDQLEDTSNKTSAEVFNQKQKLAASNLVTTNHKFTYDLLDPTTNRNRKQLQILQAKKNNTIDKNTVVLGGAITTIADYQKSNTEDKFGYLMRHPTSSNQQTKEVSEAAIHSAQLSLLGNIGDWTSAYVEMLYNPEQSFGTGTITDLNRNQVQVRRAYAVFGDLDKSPFYLSVGKMATPFGLTDTVNPFTASSVWHAFGGLAYGLNAGYYNNGLSVNVMGVQGGAQFRGHNVPVDDTNVPSKLNNYAADVNYAFDLNNAELLVGASYTKGTAYCQDFPVTHFSSCDEENGAYDIYAKYESARWKFIAEFAKTTDEWPGTFNPTIPQFGAEKVTSFALGSLYKTYFMDHRFDVSFEFSRFNAGANNSPWEKQDQWVLGFASYLQDNVKLFGEYVRPEGYTPLNFISGGNLGDGQTHSDDEAHSDVFLIGANIAF